ncbi:MAG TPA: hypothetical protein VHJ40_06205 [Actinomycetota bacterium]|nr:hypothetical protein [Actinomycetota bacterium]
MGDETHVRGGEGEMYDAIQDNPGAKNYGKDAEPLDPEQAGAGPDESEPQGSSEGGPPPA